MASDPPQSATAVLDLSARSFHDAYLAAWESTQAPDELKLSACAFVRMLRDEGVPPERVIVRVKAVLTHAGRSYSSHDHPDTRRKLVDDVVRWCIEEYYAEPPK